MTTVDETELARIEAAARGRRGASVIHYASCLDIDALTAALRAAWTREQRLLKIVDTCALCDVMARRVRAALAEPKEG